MNNFEESVSMPTEVELCVNFTIAENKRGGGLMDRWLESEELIQSMILE